MVCIKTRRARLTSNYILRRISVGRQNKHGVDRFEIDSLDPIYSSTAVRRLSGSEKIYTAQPAPYLS